MLYQKLLNRAFLRFNGFHGPSTLNTNRHSDLDATGTERRKFSREKFLGRSRQTPAFVSPTRRVRAYELSRCAFS